jgi:cell division protein FtsL
MAKLPMMAKERKMTTNELNNKINRDKRRKNLFPFISVLIFVSVLLAVVCVKMEIRRTGYVVLKLSREKRSAIAEYHREQIRFASLSRPDRIERYAQTHLELKRADRAQVIQITTPNIVLRD